MSGVHVRQNRDTQKDTRDMHTQRKGHEDTGRRKPSTSQGERPEKKV